MKENKRLNKFDRDCLLKAISVAKNTFKNGNYPVGAVLCLGNKIIDTAGNEIRIKKSFVYHAENSLIIKNGARLQKTRGKKKISLYSTLEPCIQCLGACVTNHVDKIVYIQKDPNGGACNLKHKNIGLWYKKTWPEIVYYPISETPKELMILYFNSKTKRGKINWPQKMIKLLN